jgi:hypothetical protein
VNVERLLPRKYADDPIPRRMSLMVLTGDLSGKLMKLYHIRYIAEFLPFHRATGILRKSPNFPPELVVALFVGTCSDTSRTSRSDR